MAEEVTFASELSALFIVVCTLPSLLDNTVAPGGTSTFEVLPSGVVIAADTAPSFVTLTSDLEPVSVLSVWVRVPSLLTVTVAPLATSTFVVSPVEDFISTFTSPVFEAVSSTLEPSMLSVAVTEPSSFFFVSVPAARFTVVFGAGAVVASVPVAGVSPVGRFRSIEPSVFVMISGVVGF